MGQIEDLKLFIAVVDAGGVARAAEVLGIAKSAVSRRLSALEERYSVRLIDRQPGTWDVTTAGQELYQRASPMVSDADDLDTDFIQTSASLGGPLKVSIAREFGLAFLKPTLLEFIEAHPQINLTIDFDDRTVDLEVENYDLAVRITDQNLGEPQAQALGTTRRGLYASRLHTRSTALPETIGDLKKHPLLHYGSSRRAQWQLAKDGKKRVVEFQPALNSNYGPFLVDAAIAGFGIVRLPDFIAAPAVQKGNLVPVLEDIEIEDYGIYVVYSHRRRVNKRMRLFIDALVRSCLTLKQNN